MEANRCDDEGNRNVISSSIWAKTRKKLTKGSKGRMGTDMERQGERGQGIGRERKRWRISSDS